MTADEINKLADETKRVMLHARDYERGGLTANEGWRIAERHINALRDAALRTEQRPTEPFPLTSEQISDAMETHFSITHEWPEGDEQICRAIERAHGIGG